MRQMRLVSVATKRFRRSRRYGSDQIRACHTVVPQPRDEVRMKSIFELTKREQRIVIVIVAALVAIAFAKHLMENRSRPLPAAAAPTPTSSPTVRSEERRVGKEWNPG